MAATRNTQGRTYPHTTLDVTVVALPERIRSLVTWIGVGRPLTRLEEGIGRSIRNRRLRIVAEESVAGPWPGAGVTEAEKRKVAAGDCDATAGTYEGNAVAVHIGDIEAGAVALRRGEGDLNLGIGGTEDLADEDGA